MIIKIDKKLILSSFMTAFVVICAFFLLVPPLFSPASAEVVLSKPDSFAGGTLFNPALHDTEAMAAEISDEDLSSERFHRPSKDLPLENKYNFNDYSGGKKILPVFESGEEALLAYYGILREASNMTGYSAGCGTIGNATLPYPVAYGIMSAEYRKNNTLEDFTSSFAGTGYISFMKLEPAYNPPGTSEDMKYFFIEIETIRGTKENKEDNGRSVFAYYYGIAETIRENGGWVINAIHYLPEDFLCAPYHSWWWDAVYMTEIIYIDNMKLFEKITGVERQGYNISLSAVGGKKEYMLQFVRLTNGTDILLREYVKENGYWKETSLLTGDWKNFKLSINTIL